MYKYIAALLVVATSSVTLLGAREDATAPTDSNATLAEQATAPKVLEGGKLDYSNKGYTEFPKDIPSKTNAFGLDVSGNNPSQLDLEGIRNKLPPTVQIIL